MADKSKRDTIMAALIARLARVVNSGNFEPAASPEALDELVRLCAEIDPESDPEAAQTAGLMFFYRSLGATDLDERARSFVEALALLRVVYRAGGGIIPDPLVEIYKRNPGLLGTDWYKALAADAVKLGSSSLNDPIGLSLRIAMQRKAVNMAPAESPIWFDFFSNLGLFIRERHELTNSASDIREALAIANSSLRHPDQSDSKRASLLFNLSLAHRDQYRVTGTEGDVDGWLRYAREALELVEAKSARRRTMVKNLVDALRAKHRNTPDAGLDEIIKLTRCEAALDAEPSTSPMLIDLSAALITRYESRGAIEDIDEVIPVLRRLLDHMDPSDKERAGCLSNLGIALMMRFDAKGIASDLEEGFEACRQALQIARDDDPERPMYSSNLGLLALTRAARNHWPDSELQLAISAARAALKATPPTDPQYAMFASNLATALLAGLHSAHPRPGDLDEALALSKQAADSAVGSEIRAVSKSNVAFAELRRYQATRSQSDLDDAIAQYREALASLPPEMPARGEALLAMSGALLARNAAGDLEACVVASQEAARMPNASMTTRLHAANQWAVAAGMRADWQLACQAYSEAIRLLTCIASGPLSRRDQEYALASAAGLSSRAVAAHLQMDDVEGAVKAFEHSRGVLLAHALGNRLELRALAKAHPDLAQQYQQTREQLLALDDQDLPGLVDPRTGRSAWARRPGAIGRERAALLQRLDSLLATIKSLEGFREFQSAEPTSQRYAPAANCPVVLLSVSDLRSDALVVTSGGVRLVPLPGVSPSQVENKATLLWGAVEDVYKDFSGLGTPLFAEHAIEEVLVWLWDAVVEPVMTALGISGKPRADADWPRICWCPSGFLSFLPLHAAGHHQTRADAAPRTAMDRVISTYTPTLQAQMSSPQCRTGSKPGDLLVVAMPHTPGARDLPGASVEAHFLHSLFGERARLLGEVDGQPPATVADVLKALPQNRWVHFGCHALSNMEAPSSSGLLLEDGRDHLLSVSHLMQMDLENVEMAFLSACATARPAPAVLDEAVHLASAFGVAGYRHVVAALWEISDRSAAYISEHFYGDLAKRENSIAAAADLLHRAVRQLREDLFDRPSQWAAHIHVGP